MSWQRGSFTRIAPLMSGTPNNPAHASAPILVLLGRNYNAGLFCRANDGRRVDRLRGMDGERIHQTYIVSFWGAWQIPRCLCVRTKYGAIRRGSAHGMEFTRCSLGPIPKPRPMRPGVVVRVITPKM